jgi:preprotein translocase subunit SecF
MFSFVTSCVKWIVLCFWLCVGTISFLAAQNLNRQIEHAKGEALHFKALADHANEEAHRLAEVGSQLADQLNAASARLIDAQKLRDSATESALKWRTKFEAICAQVQSLSVDVTAFTE